MTLPDASNDPVGAVLRALDLVPDPGQPDVFEGLSLPQPQGRVFGGQVLAQALLAAGRTVPDGRLPHSMHGYFLRPGDDSAPIGFAVERLRDGRSFSARRTHALQAGAPILSMIASFQEQQPGIEYAESMPEVPDPEQVASALDSLGHVDHPMARFWAQESAFDLRHVDGPIYLRADPDSPLGRQSVWARARGPVPDDQLLHRALLAYACDQIMLEPVLRRAGRPWATPGLSMASLDHAMWWHRDVRVDDWLLFTQSTPSAQGGRGLGAARVFDRSGTLVASIAQEGMVRVPD
ncbi:acyl-CoA thioesterase [Cellulomonas wangsupingiae]|uniref:Acyl-CoA thioesterase II n=1 Tax=Cellulomonas wangsupingiae TaxID=2968085 RepID=A0ABY5K9I2_9CELL|nr:acyl-CoA thioesterase II [Cellulomonas wangsupingiae]MCC2334611.1 acyl-CoA thioesterase II [Cellulomonas wangsupingiae]MCM0638668.1 acyl-CoA thioesterase II [Cellulomonas wangsupingiae]UUI66423.1 acyl-CoA thioesterase II [Cellulomonas wangsupingiae]